MSYQVLARKWRPKNFADLTGQEHVVQALGNALNQGRLHHAYLLTGTRGVGKTTIARILAKCFNCETGVSSQPCGVCRTCTEIDQGRFVDLLELDAASNTGIDHMREIIDNARYVPTAGRYKVYLIDEVHMLSKAAFNSMLKTLEEPPGHVKFVLATTDPQKIPITVLSRCLQFNLKQLAPAAIQQWLSTVLGYESIAFEPPAIALLARAAQGSMRDALSLLDQAIAYGGGQVSESVVRSMLGVVDRAYLMRIVNALQRADGAALVAEARGMAERSIAFDSALQELAVLWHKVAIAQTVPAALGDEGGDIEQLAQWAAAFSPDEVQLNYQIALQGRADLGLAPDEQAGFTMTLLRMFAFRPSQRVASSSAPVSGGGGGLGRAPLDVAVSAPHIVSTTPVQPAFVPTQNAASMSAAQPATVQVPQAAPVSVASQIAEQVQAPAVPEAAVAPVYRGEDSVQPAVTQDRPEEAHQAQPNVGAAAEAAVVPASIAFDGDWASLVKQLDLPPMALRLALECELASWDGRRVELRLPEEQKHLADRSGQLRLALSTQLQHPVAVEIVLTGTTDGSPAAIEKRERMERQTAAEEAFRNDPFVRELVEAAGARIRDETVQPVESNS